MALPASATGSSYGMPAGGFVNRKQVANPNTDWSGDQASKLIADAAGMTRTAQRFWAVFTTGASSGAMVAVAWDAVWGENNSNAAPVLAWASTGCFTVTLPQNIIDVFGNSQPLNLQRVGASVQLTTLTSPTLYTPEPALLSPYQLGVAVWKEGAPAALSNDVINIHIWGG